MKTVTLKRRVRCCIFMEIASRSTFYTLVPHTLTLDSARRGKITIHINLPSHHSLSSSSYSSYSFLQSCNLAGKKSGAQLSKGATTNPIKSNNLH